MEVSCHFHFHFMQRAAVHILVYATCCSKIKRDARSEDAFQPEDPEVVCAAHSAPADDSSEGGSDDSARVSR